MTFPQANSKRKTKRAELLRRRAELSSEQAEIDRELARLEEAEPDTDAGLVDQNASPLGKRLHLKLAPELGGVKAGKRVLISREAIDRYLAAHPVVRTTRERTPTPTAPVDSVDAALAELGARRATG